MGKSKNEHKKESANKIVQLVRKEYSSSEEWYKNRSFGDVIYPEDSILRKDGYTFKKYRSLLSDEQIKACFKEQRVAGVVAADWEIKPASDTPLDKEIAEFITDNLLNISFDDKCRKMLYANWYGYQAAEILWDLKDDKIIISDIKVRRPERFVFGIDGDLYLKRTFFDKEALPDRKFWVHKASGDNDDDIYGEALANTCYWPVYLKRNGLKFWSVLVEKFAVPTAVGKYIPGTSDDDIRSLLSMLDAISTETSIAVPEGTVVELLESIKVSGGDHEKFCQYLDKIIAKAILGQDGTSQNGAYAGTASVQQDVATTIIKADADLLCESFNEVIKWLVEYNWPESMSPKIKRIFEEPENLSTEADKDLKICNMGFKPKLSYISEKYGGEWEINETPSMNQMPNFSESKSIETFDDWEEVMAPIINPIEEILESCNSFSEFEKRLIEAYPKMNTSKLQELLGNATFSSRINGALGIRKDE